MAEQGYFVKEMNAGWAEWIAEELPTHSQPQIDKGHIRCDCFKQETGQDAEIMH